MTNTKTKEDLVHELEVLVTRDAFDTIMDASTTDNKDIIRVFRSVFPGRYKRAVETAVKEAIQCGANEYRVTNAGFRMQAKA